MVGRNGLQESLVSAITMLSYVHLDVPGSGQVCPGGVAMSEKRNSSTPWFLPVIMLFVLALSCNMPGWGDKATETPQPLETIQDSAAATSTPVEDDMVGEMEEDGVEELGTEDLEQDEASAMEFDP